MAVAFPKSELKIMDYNRVVKDLNGLSAEELLKALDPIATSEIILLVPPTAHDIPKYKNIRVQQVGSKGGIRWEQTSLRKFINSNKSALYFLNKWKITSFTKSKSSTTS